MNGLVSSSFLDDKLFIPFESRFNLIWAFSAMLPWQKGNIDREIEKKQRRREIQRVKEREREREKDEGM